MRRNNIARPHKIVDIEHHFLALSQRRHQIVDEIRFGDRRAMYEQVARTLLITARHESVTETRVEPFHSSQHIRLCTGKNSEAIGTCENGPMTFLGGVTSRDTGSLFSSTSSSDEPACTRAARHQCRREAFSTRTFDASFVGS